MICQRILVQQNLQIRQTHRFTSPKKTIFVILLILYPNIYSIKGPFINYVDRTFRFFNTIPFHWQVYSLSICNNVDIWLIPSPFNVNIVYEWTLGEFTVMMSRYMNGLAWIRFLYFVSGITEECSRQSLVGQGFF